MIDAGWPGVAFRQGSGYGTGHGPVAQLDRASPSEGEGRRFESFRVRHPGLPCCIGRRRLPGSGRHRRRASLGSGSPLMASDAAFRAGVMVPHEPVLTMAAVNTVGWAGPRLEFLERTAGERLRSRRLPPGGSRVERLSQAAPNRTERSLAVTRQQFRPAGARNIYVPAAQRSLVFLHVPKCGGTSATTALQSSFRQAITKDGRLPRSQSWRDGSPVPRPRGAWRRLACAAGCAHGDVASLTGRSSDLELPSSHPQPPDCRCTTLPRN